MTIGITGGIGSGKSYVCAVLKEHFGIPVYDCDREAKRLNVESDEIRRQLVALVGPEVYDKDGQLQRSVLADFLFKNADNAQRINAIIHPVVAEDFKQWAAHHSMAAMESAILFESGFNKLVDKVIAVTAPYELCLQRAMKRDKADKATIERRIKMQMSNEERNSLADFTVINDGRDLIDQLQDILEAIDKPQR